MTQYARPSADISIGNWTKQDTGTSTLYTTIDEVSASDSDYIVTSDSGMGPQSATTVKFHLADTISNPGTTGHKVICRARLNAGDARALTISLRESTTEIQAITTGSGGVDALDGTFENVTLTVGTSQAGDIETYNDLQIWLTAGTGSGDDEIQVSHLYLETPDVPVAIKSGGIPQKLMLNELF